MILLATNYYNGIICQSIFKHPAGVMNLWNVNESIFFMFFSLLYQPSYVCRMQCQRIEQIHRRTEFSLTLPSSKRWRPSVAVICPCVYVALRRKTAAVADGTVMAAGRVCDKFESPTPDVSSRLDRSRSNGKSWLTGRRRRLLISRL